MALAEKVRALAKAEAELTEANRRVEELKTRKTSLRRQITAALEDAELESAKVDGQLVSRYELPQASVSDPAAFRAWAEQHDEEWFEPERRVRKDQLNQEVRRRLDDGEQLPPGVSVYFEPRLSRTKA